jgi:U4/U6 small nuclear ribonucleoprotein PRP3
MSDIIAQKKAEIAAKLAAMKKIAPSGGVSAQPQPAASPSPSTPSTPKTSADDMTKRIAEAKARVAAAQKQLAVKDNPYMVSCHNRSPFRYS